MSKMFYEDREYVVECRYGQLSSTEQIKKKNRNKTKRLAVDVSSSYKP